LGVEQFSGLLQIAAIVAAACLIILNTSSDVFSVEQQNVVPPSALPAGEQAAFVPKYQGALARKVRRRIRRHSALIYGTYAILALVVITSLIATNLVHGCAWLEERLASAEVQAPPPEAAATGGAVVRPTPSRLLPYLPHVRTALGHLAFDPRNLAIWFVVLAAILILVLTKIARDTTRVRHEYMESKVGADQRAGG
jgi:hypothetical protein